MAAAFFQGTVGNFSSYNAFSQNTMNGGANRTPDGRPLGQGSAPVNSSASDIAGEHRVRPNSQLGTQRVTEGAQGDAPIKAGARGAAGKSEMS